MSASFARIGRRFGWPVWALSCIALAALAFYLPALRVSHGHWPTPLDDSYIYYGFARSAAQGEPFVWVAGNGYSSGATSPIYPLLLAPFWALGLRGSWLGLGAALVAAMALFDLSRSLRATLSSPLAKWAAPALLVALPLLDWSWFSAMELAFFGAVAGRALRQTQRSFTTAAPARPRAQWRAGLWLALLVLARPESVALVATLALAIAYRGRTTSALGSLLRSTTPAAATLCVQALFNRFHTGEYAAAGAVRKLYAYGPFESVHSDAIEVAKNLFIIAYQAGVRAWGGLPLGLASVAVWMLAVASPRHRTLSIASLAGAFGMVLLSCLNNTARYQNYRYAAPALALGCCVLAWGIDSLARRPRLAVVATLAVLLAPAGEFARQRNHFALASRNIVEQQLIAAEQLRSWQPPVKRVLVGDAGAIAYLSELPALDGLGLGGYHDYPFARASRHGVAAVVELIERLPASERPDAMALYPGWWDGLADVFGQPISRVRIEDNVICAADTKVLYRADWRSLDSHEDTPTGAWLSLDVGNLMDERRYAYRTGAPRSGRLVARSLALEATHATSPADNVLWDAGRVFPLGSEERFVVGGAIAGASQLWLRVDSEDGARQLEVEVRRDAQVVKRASVGLPRHPGRWSQVQVSVGQLQNGDTIALRALGGAWRSYQLWLTTVR